MEKDNKKIIIRITISVIFFIITFLIQENIIVKLCLYLISYIVVGFDIIKEAVENILHGKIFDENFLMFIATIGAFIIGEYPEAVAVMVLYQIGEFFEDYAIDKSKDSISELMDIRPDYAYIELNGELIKVHPNEVEIGSIITVKPGEKIPLDGIITNGKSSIDTSSITGESILQKVDIGSTVYSGTINKLSVIQIKTTKKFEDSTVCKILNLVENASHKKAKAENFITKFARFYTPLVVICALLIAILPPIFLKETSYMEYIHRACTFLVISCPCALVISIPLGFFAGIGGASKNGILIKGSNYIEILTKIKTIIFDKTGTLSKGSFEVTKISPINISEEELINYATYAEYYSNHPIAISLKKSYNKPINNNLIVQSTDIPGKGIKTYLDKDEIIIGNIQLMNELGLDLQEHDEIGTILYISINNKYEGYIVISDKIKDESRNTITQLKKKGIYTIMLTGDKEKIANQVAKELYIDEVYSELLPQNKVAQLEKVLSNNSKYGISAFVGDGTNDAPALARADIGIAMGGVGSDAAIEAADVVIMDDNLSKINLAIEIANKTLRIVKENIFLAIFIKIFVLLLSAFGYSAMWVAVFADVGVALIAILNSMRALK